MGNKIDKLNLENTKSNENSAINKNIVTLRKYNDYSGITCSMCNISLKGFSDKSYCNECENKMLKGLSKMNK